MRTQKRLPDPRLRSQPIRATTCLLLLLLCSGLQAVVAGNFLVNPGFEDGTDQAAPPWSLWEGTGGAVANPLVNADNPSARVWFNTGGGRNLAAANNVNLILDTTGTVTYHVKVKFYVPSVTADSYASAMIRFHAGTPAGTTYVAGDPILLDDALPEGEVTTGSWVTKEFDWVNTSPMGFMEYLSFRMYRRDSLTFARVTPAPDVYFDDCEFSSSQYRNDVHGVVKDNVGAPLAGATVTLENAYGVLASQTTAADGTYAFTTMLPYGAYTVNARKFTYTPGSAILELSAAGAAVPDITLAKMSGLARLSGVVKHEGAGVDGVTVNAVSTSGGGTAWTVTATLNNVVGSYSLEVPPDTYVVTASRLPLAAPAENVPVSMDMTLDLTLQSVLLVGVYADALTAGPLATWANQGTLGGQFEPLGAAAPVAGTQGQFKAVNFNNSPMVLREAGVPVTTPAEITGNAATYTVCAWLYEPDPVLPDQQTYLAWAKRGGPDGSNCELVYGTNPTWGAAGHWGAPDMPWGTPPSGGVWHNVIVTWDGAVETSYIDGAFSATETKTLDIAPALPIVLGSGYGFDGANISPDIPFSGHMAQVEVFGAAASAAEVARLASLSPQPLPIGTLMGKLMTSDGSPSAGFIVKAKDAAGNVQAVTATGADGSYRCVVPAPGTYTVAATKPTFVTMPGPQTATVAIGATVTLGDFTATPSTIHGVLVDATTGTPIYNGVVQVGGVGGQALVTTTTGAYSLPGTGCGGIEIFADALGYHCKNLFVTGVGDVAKEIALAPEAETGVLVNGGFENVAEGQPTDWGEKWVAGGLQFTASTDAFSGTYSVWYTGSLAYSALAQYVPITAGSVYNCYFKAKADLDVGEWFPMFSFRSANDDELKGWIGGEPGYDGWVHNPPKTWMQYLLFHTYSGDATQPFVRIAPPANAVDLAASFCFSGLPPADKGCYVDDVVIDKVAADEPLVTVPPDSNVPPTPVLPPEGFKVAGGVPTFTFEATTGFKYRIVWKNTVTEPGWTPGAWSAVASVSGPLTITDPTAGGQPHRFYRIEAAAP